MKKKYNLQILIVLLLFVASSCTKTFLEMDPNQSVADESSSKPIKNTKDVYNALIGSYCNFGSANFMGRYVPAIAEMAGDNAYMKGTSGHFDAIYTYTIIEQSADILPVWQGGYSVIDECARLIDAGQEILNKGGLLDTEIASIKSSLAQAHTLKALSYFYLVNIFALPIHDGVNDNSSTLGVVIADHQIIPFAPIQRSTVGEVYTKILEHLAKAKQLFNESGDTPDQKYINPAAVWAAEARVYLYMRNFTGAINSANQAVNLRGELVTNVINYANMWKDIAITPEDIFTIAKTADDNLSANSLNTVYGSYDGYLTDGLLNLFDPADIRFATSQTSGAKFQGMPSSKATSNIPVLRTPELYLILAEAYAQNNDVVNSRINLLKIASRNPAYTVVGDLPDNKTDLLAFIETERRRELYQEGHRFFDLRRTHTNLNRGDDDRKPYQNYEIWRFAYPIPFAERNASNLTQNPASIWQYLPSK